VSYWVVHDLLPFGALWIAGGNASAEEDGAIFLYTPQRVATDGDLLHIAVNLHPFGALWLAGGNAFEEVDVVIFVHTPHRVAIGGDLLQLDLQGPQVLPRPCGAIWVCGGNASAVVEYVIFAHTPQRVASGGDLLQREPIFTQCYRLPTTGTTPCIPFPRYESVASIDVARCVQSPNRVAIGGDLLYLVPGIVTVGTILYKI